jgi:hypothetical protein
LANEPVFPTKKEAAMYRPLCVLTLLLIAALPASAADEKAQPNTLTPKEITDGWILLFDGQTTFGWKIEGEAKVEDGVLVLGGSKATKAETTTAIVGQSFSLVEEISWQGDTPPRRPRVGKEGTPLGDNSKGKFVAEEVVVRGSGIPAPFEPLAFEVPAGSTLMLRNVKYRPVFLKPIFNGKDLTGWKEIPGRPSTYTVTAQGELNVKNGPGDLQTEGQWADFILQLDVIANGKHLNSGVFFRSLPGQFWSGYEVQIRNQWQGDDRTKPVDFGTGAIYNRQPARKVVSDDGQWFTMTVIAQGNHVAVWVNGYQVTDFTDARPASNNARRGTKLDAGPISLQGHDPTTDLSFLNIRIAELPREGDSE